MVLTQEHLVILCLKSEVFFRFADINKSIIARFMYRWYLNDIPDLFHGYFTPVSAVHYHFTGQSDGLFIATFKTNPGKTCLTYRGPYIWNKIKIKIKNQSRFIGS